jgi:hypothetical protein
VLASAAEPVGDGLAVGAAQLGFGVPEYLYELVVPGALMTTQLVPTLTPAPVQVLLPA